MLDFYAYLIFGAVLVSCCEFLGYGLVLLLGKVMETIK